MNNKGKRGLSPVELTIVIIFVIALTAMVTMHLCGDRCLHDHHHEHCCGELHSEVHSCTYV